MQVNESCDQRLGIVPGKTYHAFDLWANEPVPDFSGSFKLQVAPRSCSVIAVRADEGHPVVLSNLLKVVAEATRQQTPLQSAPGINIVNI